MPDRDPYLYKGTSVLKNKLNIKVQEHLDRAEGDYTSLRLAELAENPLDGDYDFAHLCAIHGYIFQDLFDWAGKPRMIDIQRPEPVLGGWSVEYSPHVEITSNTRSVLATMNATNWADFLLRDVAEKFSSCFAELWKIHPFREGNTRTVTHFCCQFLDSVGIEINRRLFEENAAYLRTTLVAYDAVFKEGDFSQKEHLREIIYDAMNIESQK
jgi:Protein involved in cell division